jgi:hypothetical protein
MEIKGCEWKTISIAQRANEMSRGLNKSGTKQYEDTGCYGCDGTNLFCEKYFAKNSTDEYNLYVLLQRKYPNNFVLVEKDVINYTTTMYHIYTDAIKDKDTILQNFRTQTGIEGKFSYKDINEKSPKTSQELAELNEEVMSINKLCNNYFKRKSITGRFVVVHSYQEYLKYNQKV